MNTYPGFYRATDGKEYLYLDKVNYFSFERGIWDKSDSCDNHEKDTNITREYLANTKVEIESEEHKEFILKLLKVNDLYFSYLSGASFIYISGVENTIVYNPKEITIPLPPKESEPKCWPQVGDDVAWSPKLSRKGALLNVYEGMAWIKDSYGEFVSIEVNKLKKPLTQEEELATKITQLENFKNKLAGYACGCSWDDIFTTMTEAKKHKASLENLYTDGFSSRPYIKLDMLKNIRNELLEIESILKVIFSDDEDFSHVSFSDVSANGIQVYVVGKERSYNYGFRATLNYDLSNKVSVIEMFLKRNKQQ